MSEYFQADIWFIFKCNSLMAAVESLQSLTSRLNIFKILTMKFTHFWSNKSGRRMITPPLAKTKSGDVAGFHLVTEKGPVNVFLGIPYAQPPVGDLRFQVWLPFLYIYL